MIIHQRMTGAFCSEGNSPSGVLRQDHTSLVRGLDGGVAAGMGAVVVTTVSTTTQEQIVRCEHASRRRVIFGMMQSG